MIIPVILLLAAAQTGEAQDVDVNVTCNLKPKRIWNTKKLNLFAAVVPLDQNGDISDKANTYQKHNEWVMDNCEIDILDKDNGNGVKATCKCENYECAVRCGPEKIKNRESGGFEDGTDRCRGCLNSKMVLVSEDMITVKVYCENERDKLLCADEAQTVGFDCCGPGDQPDQPNLDEVSSEVDCETKSQDRDIEVVVRPKKKPFGFFVPKIYDDMVEKPCFEEESDTECNCSEHGCIVMSRIKLKGEEEEGKWEYKQECKGCKGSTITRKVEDDKITFLCKEAGMKCRIKAVTKGYGNCKIGRIKEGKRMKIQYMSF